jgi:hypothetical protein
MCSGPTLLLAVALTTAQSPAVGSDPLRAVSPAGDRPVGHLLKFTPQGTAELTTGSGLVVVHDVVSLRRADTPLPPHPPGPTLVTNAGDRVPGRLLGGDVRGLRFQPTLAAAEWEVPFTAVTTVWLTAPPADYVAGLTGGASAARNRDQLRFRNGDVAAGTLDGFAADGRSVRFTPDGGGERAVLLASLGALAFNPKLASVPRPKGVVAAVVLRDGTRLSVTEPTADGTTLRGKTLFGQVVSLPVAEVVAVDVARGKATDLSALRPRAEQGGFLRVGWPWAADRTVRGLPLRLLTARGVETFDRGLGTHPKTVLTYDLAGKYRRFEALVGCDPVTGGRGRAAVRVLVDEQDRTPPALRDLAPGPAVAVEVELSGARRLVLSVDFAGTGGVQADVNWADARLFE